MPKGVQQQLTLEKTEVLTPLLGASLLSSVGSLPLHLTPLIVTTLIADSRTSVAGAGWVPSVMLLGQLSTSLALPALKIHYVGRVLAIVTAVVLLAGLGVSSADNFFVILFGWFLAGQCCGVLMYLGTIAASRFSRRVFAFSLRLAIVLLLAGSVSGLLQTTNAFSSYRALLSQLIVIFVPILACGIMLYGSAGGQTGIDSSDESPWTVKQVSGFAAVYFFFIGQTGFLAYVIQQALARGMTLHDTVWAMAAMKVAAGVWLLGILVFEFQRRGRERFLHQAFTLVSAILIVFYSRDIIVFFLGLLIFEITLNNLSARLQSAVVAARPELTGPWLTGVILLGAAAGPPLNGLAISFGLEGAFILISVLSALGPLLWWRLGGSGAKAH
jgi:hypothetical protein